MDLTFGSSIFDHLLDGCGESLCDSVEFLPVAFDKSQLVLNSPRDPSENKKLLFIKGPQYAKVQEGHIVTTLQGMLPSMLHVRK